MIEINWEEKMKNIYIKELREGLDFIDFFVVKNAGIKLGANRKQYLDITLGDKTGDITGKKWDVADEEIPIFNEIKEGDLIKVKASVNLYKDIKQLRITRIRIAEPSDALEIKDFIKAAPEDSISMLEFLLKEADSMEDIELKRLCNKVLKENREKLIYYPAAAKNHHAEYGGLLYHMKRMVLHGIDLCKIYPILNKDLLVTGVILHDIEKLNEILSNEQGISTGYSFEGNMLGHLVQGVKKVSKWAEELGIGEEKSIMLQHMIISHHYEPEFGSPKKPLFPEAEALHYLDIMDARMYDFEEALECTEAGEFSERVWTLDNRRIYKVIEKTDV